MQVKIIVVYLSILSFYHSGVRLVPKLKDISLNFINIGLIIYILSGNVDNTSMIYTIKWDVMKIDRVMKGRFYI